MKIAEYNQMMAYLMRPKFNGGGYVKKKSTYQRVDPAKNQNILRQKETEKKLKDFAAEFKKDNGRVPMIKEIQEETGSAHREVTKYLKQSEYATPKQALKFKVQKEAKDIPDEMKDWFKKNYPGKDWKKDLTTSQRGGAKAAFKNRNAPTVLSRAKYEKLDKFLKKRIEDNKTLFKGGLKDIAKEAKVDLNSLQVGDYITSKFPGEFVYRGTKISEVPKIRKRVVELAKTMSDKQVYEQLVEEKLINPFGGKKADYRNVTQLMKELEKEGKIKDIIKNPLSEYTPQEEKLRDKIVKTYIQQNPDVDNANAIAKGINASNPSLKMSSTFVKNSVNRQDLGDFIQSRHKKIFNDVKALDKIIKNNPDLVNNLSKEELLSKYAKAVNKDIAIADGELVSRMRKLGNLYAGDVGRYEVDLYSQIKPPKNYIDSNFQKNFILTTSRTGKISNISMAKLLGLPEAERALIQGTASMMNVFDFKVAGDHTDIKAIMRDFPNYRKNFSRIEYVKNDLNEFKRGYDIKINNLRKKAEQTSGSAQKALLRKAENLQKEFNRATGYRVGGFGLEKGRVTINPQTERLSNLKNPYNTALSTAMKNFETTSVPGETVEKYTGLDKRLMNANASEKTKIFKDVQGTKAAKESLYLKALQKVPKIGPIATKVIAGTAGAVGMSTLAQASDDGGFVPTTTIDGDLVAMEPTKTDAKTLNEFAKDKTSFPTKTALGTGAGAATLGTKTGRSLLGKAFRAIGTPLGGTGFALTNVASKMKEGQSLADAVVDPLTGLELSFPGLFKENLKKIIPERFQGRAARFGRGLLGLRGIPVGPIGLTLAGLGQAQEFYNQYQDLQKMKRDDPEAYQQFISTRVAPALSSQDYNEIYSDVQGAAGGGIAKLAGKSSGPAPESGPTPQGLDFLMKRGR